ncbi:hypothetical protein [Luteolibacter sp. LG18]|uniref:hypothetical protein n=1 Tax=Luteolibacter sp. LG18 TaxID=2819286 RepID=UPI002B2C8E97|nr:hypothetical protein llg_20750 [Luteolibacter sp. LG18]
MSISIATDARAADLAKVRQARLMPPGMKFRAGGDLFEEACLWTLAGIAHQRPDLDEAGRMKELRRRLDLANKASA